jgi:hypothetical protein
VRNNEFIALPGTQMARPLTLTHVDLEVFQNGMQLRKNANIHYGTQRMRCCALLILNCSIDVC